jgi:multiphosphoryl transfer protein
VRSRAANKQEAIRQAGQLLVDSGYIDAGYIASLLGREEVANTYLGNGISIPHGLPQDRDLIKQTGIAVVQVPAGVTWNPGETAHLVVGIAAKSDEHIEVLRRLTRDPRDIIEALTGERPAVPPKSADTADYAVFFDTVVRNKTGLHARPAATFVDLAKRSQANIRVRHYDSVANGKSLISLLQLGVEHGSTIRVSAEGADAAAALDALKAAIAVGLGDEPEEQLPPAPGSGIQGWAPQAPGATIVGIPASGGLAIGPVRQYKQQPIIVIADHPSDPITEGDQLQNALNAAQDELDRLHEEVKTRLGSGKAAIFRVHGEFLNDATLVMQTISLIYQGHTAAWAWQHVINERVSQMQHLDDPIPAVRGG